MSRDRVMLLAAVLAGTAALPAFGNAGAMPREVRRVHAIHEKEVRMTLRRPPIAAAAAAALLALVAAGAASPARATVSGGSVCKTFAVAGLTPRWSVIGNVSCSQAKPWLKRLLSERGRPETKLVFKDPPRGFKCSAFVDKHGRPSVGACYTGTAAFPKNGFQWLA